MIRSHVKKINYITAGIFFILALWWVFILVPKLSLYRSDFSLKIDIASVDNLYDEVNNKFSGEKTSRTTFSYETTASKNGILTIDNVFDVRTLQGDSIFSVHREYGIDARTGAHVKNFGDRNREGHLFAPKHLKKGQPFIYWHINYDGPAYMEFVSEEKLFGLNVYKYETNYQNVLIDQTKNLENLPGVGITRGIKLDPRLTLWIEPVSGRMVKYQDETIAYYDRRNTKPLE
jgi:hypothetical protein